MAVGLPENQGFVLVTKEDAVSPSAPAGTYKAPAAGDAVQVLNEGLAFNPTQEIVDRDIRTSTIEQREGRTTTRGITLTIPTELRANTTEGGAPEPDKLYESVLGGKRQRSDTTLQTASSQTAVSNKRRAFAVDAGDIAKFRIGDPVRIFSAGVIDFVSVVTAVNSATNQVTLVSDAPVNIPGDAAISPCTTYYPDPNRADARYLSCTQYLGGRIEERAIGCKGTGVEISNFQTGQLPQAAFNLEGLDFARNTQTTQQIAAARALATYQQSLPPIILGAKVFQDEKELVLNSLGITITNTLGFLMSTASERGKISSRVTDFDCTFTMNPYQDDANVDNFNLFRTNESFSLFAFAANKDADGKLEQIVTVFMPNCKVQEISTGSEDGILTDDLTGRSFLQNGNDTVFFGFM